MDELHLELPDGRVFQGSPVAVVAQMRSLAFEREESLESYIRWSCQQARAHLGIEIAAEGDTLSALASSFLDSVVRAGLAARR